jgi:hypothetical protein
VDLDALIAHLALDSGRLALAIVMAQSKLAIALGPQRSQNCDRIGADPMAGLDQLAGGSGHRRESRDWRFARPATSPRSTPAFVVGRASRSGLAWLDMSDTGRMRVGFLVAASVGEGGRERFDLVGLMLQETGEDLFEGALPVAESEAPIGWDRIQLGVCQHPDPAEGGAGG